jgi:hypothetical protein
LAAAATHRYVGTLALQAAATRPPQCLAVSTPASGQDRQSLLLGSGPHPPDIVCLYSQVPARLGHASLAVSQVPSLAVVLWPQLGLLIYLAVLLWSQLGLVIFLAVSTPAACQDKQWVVAWGLCLSQWTAATHHQAGTLPLVTSSCHD